jgi:hypothetical protein
MCRTRTDRWIARPDLSTGEVREGRRVPFEHDCPVQTEVVLAATSSTRGGHTALRGWGLAAAGAILLIGAAAFIPIVRARNPDATSKYIPQGSEGFKVVLSTFLAIVRLAMLVLGVVQGSDATGLDVPNSVGPWLARADLSPGEVPASPVGSVGRAAGA